MPDEAKSSARRDVGMQAQDWGAACGAFLESNQHACAHWVQAMFAFSQEIARFTQARLQEDMAAWSALAACHNPEQAIEWQRRFAAKAAEQYSEEIGKLSQMMVRMSSESLPSPSQQRPHATR